MIEREFVKQNLKELQVKEFLAENLKRAGHSATKLQRTPLGEKVIVYASRPGLVVGRKGENINKLTKALKNRFKLENPQIEISEVENPDLDANVVAERITNSLERFGTSEFKGIGHKTMGRVLQSGAIGIEILMSGKIPGSRAKSWRFYQGYLKKCGDIVEGVSKAVSKANLKTGVVGVKVSIMPPDLVLPDHVEILREPEEIIEEVKTETVEEEKVETKDESKKVKKPVKKVKDKKEPVKEEKSEPVKEKVQEPIKEDKEPKDESKGTKTTN